MRKLGKKLNKFMKLFLAFGLLFNNLSSLSIVFADEIPSEEAEVKKTVDSETTLEEPEVEEETETEPTDTPETVEFSVDLKDSYVVIKNGECYALNIYIAKYEQGNIFNHDERRTRKLLLHKAEIKKLYKLREEDGISIIPLSMFISNNYAKLKIGVCKGKKLYDKRQAIKEKDFEKMSRYN